MANDLTLSADQIERYRAELHRLFNHHSGVDALCDMALRALPSATPAIPDSVRRISIPTETMEQEFAAYERRGYERGKAETLAAAPQQGQTPTGYCVVNNAGEMWWDEGCVCQDASALQESADDMAESEPDAGWRVAPFYAGAARQGKAPVVWAAEARDILSRIESVSPELFARIDKLLLTAPLVEAEATWVRVEERLPTDEEAVGGHVLCLTKNCDLLYALSPEELRTQVHFAKSACNWGYWMKPPDAPSSQPGQSE